MKAKIVKQAFDLMLKMSLRQENSLRIKIPKLLKWTDTYTALVELIYGVQNLSVSFGKGKLDEIAACFEFIFQVKLGRSEYLSIQAKYNIQQFNNL